MRVVVMARAFVVTTLMLCNYFSTGVSNGYQTLDSGVTVRGPIMVLYFTASVYADRSRHQHPHAPLGGHPSTGAALQHKVCIRSALAGTSSRPHPSQQLAS